MRLIHFFIPLLFLSSCCVKAGTNYQTPNMNLTIPVPGPNGEPGPNWAYDLNGSLTILDAHDHSPGNGVQITPNGMNISSNLPFNGNFITQLGGGFFTAQLSDPSTNASIYSKGVDLYYKDANGNVIQITKSGGVNSAAGNIQNLPSTPGGGAGISWLNSQGTFQFFNDTGTGAANMDGGTAILRYPGSYPNPSGNFIALEAPTSLATGFAFTLPANLPGSNGSFFTSSTSGGLSYTNADESTLHWSSGTLAVKSGGITGTQMASNNNLPGKSVQENGNNLVVSQTNATNSLAIIRGQVNSNGTVGLGEGFSSSKTGTGTYSISFSTSFGDTPVVVVSPYLGDATYTVVTSISSSGATIIQFDPGTGAIDNAFTFIAIGQRP